MTQDSLTSSVESAGTLGVSAQALRHEAVGLQLYSSWEVGESTGTRTRIANSSCSRAANRAESQELASDGAAADGDLWTMG